MAVSLAFYEDAGLTTLVDKVRFIQATDDSLPLTEKKLFLGSPVAGRTFEAQSDPGVDQISVSPVDASPGPGLEVTMVKLAATMAGLAGATPGDPLDVGAQVFGGVGNAVEVWVALIDTNLAQGTYSDVTLETNDLIEY